MLLIQAQVSTGPTCCRCWFVLTAESVVDRARSREGSRTGGFPSALPPFLFQHQALAFLEFARHLGADTDKIDRRLPLDESARRFARDPPARARSRLTDKPSLQSRRA